MRLLQALFCKANYAAFPLSMLLIGVNVAYLENLVGAIPFLVLMIFRSVIGVICSLLVLALRGNLRLLNPLYLTWSDVKSSALKSIFGVLDFSGLATARKNPEAKNFGVGF